MGHTWKIGSHLYKWVTLRKNVLHLENWVTLEKLGHAWKSGLHLDNG